MDANNNKGQSQMKKFTGGFLEAIPPIKLIKPYIQPDIDICSSCGEHTEFTEDGSDCCGAAPYDTDPDTDMER